MQTAPKPESIYPLVRFNLGPGANAVSEPTTFDRGKASRPQNKGVGVSARHFPATFHFHPQKQSKMSAPSAMCTVETVNGREYKVRDMAQADFGE